MTIAADKIAISRLIACRRVPYFRSAIMSLRPLEVSGYGTLGVTADAVMLYDPDTIKGWKKEQLAAVLIHESLHLLRDHAGRLNGRDPEAWNIAADAEINDDLVEMGCDLPEDPVLPSRLGMPGGLSAEEYYRRLREKNKKQEQNPDGKPSKAGGPCRGSCGGCAGNPEPKEAEAAGAAEGRTSREMERTRRTVAAAIREVARHGRGSVPAGLARWAGDVMQAPRVPWQQRLARAVRRGIAYRPGAVDMTYGRISRRQAGVGFGPGRPILPALHAPCPRVGVVVDTSGSMGTAEIEACMRELRGVLAAVGADVEYASADAAVQTSGRIRSVGQAKLAGGGGTDMKPVLKHMEEKRPNLDIVVVATDGHIGDPGPAPSFRVIWLLINSKQKPADFGEVVEVGS